MKPVKQFNSACDLNLMELLPHEIPETLVIFNTKYLPNNDPHKDNILFFSESINFTNSTSILHMFFAGPSFVVKKQEAVMTKITLFCKYSCALLALGN